MESRAHALAAGIFTLLLGLGIAAAVFWFSGQREATREYILVSRGNVAGLNTQAQVRYRGIRAGKVQAIGLDPQDPRNILITIRVNAELPVTRGTTARLSYQGVTGLASILLEDKGENPEPLTATASGPPRIDLQPGFMDSLGENASDLMAQMRQVLERGNALLSDQNVRRLGQTLAHIEAASAGLATSVKDLPAVVAALRRALSDENLGRLSAILAHTDRAATEAAPLFTSLQELTRRLETLLAETGGELNQATLPRLNLLLQELTTNARLMTRLLEQIEESPNMLIFGREVRQPGPGEVGFAAKP